MKKCPYCAQDIQDEAIKCRYCWEFLVAEQPKSAKRRAGDSVRLVTGIFFGILLKISIVLALASFIYFGLSSLFSQEFSSGLRFLFTKDFLTTIKELLVPSKVISKIAYFYLLVYFSVILTKIILLGKNSESRQLLKIKKETIRQHILKRGMVLGSGVVAGFALVVLVLLGVFKHWDDAPFAYEESMRISSGRVYEDLKSQLDSMEDRKVDEVEDSNDFRSF